MPFRRDRRRTSQIETPPEPNQEELIPVIPVAECEEPKEPDVLFAYLRFLGVFFLMFIVGILIGVGFSKGVHTVIIVLSFTFSINGGIIYFYGFQRLRDQCTRCFDKDHDGNLTRDDCRTVFANRSTEIIICGISGFFIGVLVGLLSF